MKSSKAKLFLLLFALVVTVTLFVACDKDEPSVTTTVPSVTTTVPSVTTTVPSVTTSVPSATTTAPTVTTAPSVTTPETPADLFRFEKQWDGTYVIVGYTGNEETILIPKTYNGKAVTAIGSSAFRGCTGLRSVTIGDGVETIGEDAFSGCYKLVEVYNRSGLTITKGSSNHGIVGYYALNVYTPTSGESKLHTVGDYTFYEDGETVYLMAYTGTDTSITLPDYKGKDYAIYWHAFYRRDDLTSVTIPDSVTSIGERAFSGCTGLESVKIGNSVETIGAYAFSGCTGLKSVTIPDSVKTIGYSAFYGCKGLESVTIGNSVETIGSYAFDGCTALESITFLDTTTWYRTTNSSNWQNKAGGTLTDLTTPSQNATYFKSTYYNYYWYKN